MNDNKRVYICDVDFIYTKEAEEFEKYAGGAVYIFIKAFDVREALALLTTDLHAKNIELNEVVSIAPYNVNQEWETEEEQTHYLYLYKECEKLHPIVYDDFMVYEKE